jgi:hypothetical protein
VGMRVAERKPSLNLYRDRNRIRKSCNCRLPLRRVASYDCQSLQGSGRALFRRQTGWSGRHPMN